MSSNLTVEAPNFQKILKEAGQFTADAVNLLWSALNDTRAVSRRDSRLATELIEPKVKTVNAAASVDNLDLEGSSIVSFTGTTGQNFTGMRAPETGKARVVIIQNNGSGTITLKHNVTSETANQLTNDGGADVSLSTGKGTIYVYLSAKWREVHR